CWSGACRSSARVRPRSTPRSVSSGKTPAHPAASQTSAATRIQRMASRYRWRPAPCNGRPDGAGRPVAPTGGLGYNDGRLPPPMRHHTGTVLGWLVLGAAGWLVVGPPPGASAAAASLTLTERERQEAIRVGQRSIVNEAFGAEWQVRDGGGQIA